MFSGDTDERMKKDLLDAENFKRNISGKELDLFTLSNDQGIIAQITNYGARLASLWVPDAKGHMADIVLGFEKLEDYFDADRAYYGATIGRFANRIADASFFLNGATYKLARNFGQHHLHGGNTGFESVVWEAEQKSDNELILTYLSKDGEEGYPGNLEVELVYKLTQQNELLIEYRAQCDKDCPVNLTHHSYFNLKGAGEGAILDHILSINADYYLPVGPGMIPTGELAVVKGTPMDFRTPHSVGCRVNKDFEQLKIPNGYDHTWVINAQDGAIGYAAEVLEPNSGRIMRVLTNEPGMQFFSGNVTRVNDVGKGGKPYLFRGSFCLETQHFPNSPNQPNFPNTILKTGDTYHSVCVYQFDVLRK